MAGKVKKHDCNFFYGKTIETNLKDGGRQRMIYCPICGSLLGHNEPLSLDELLELSGQPVYITCKEYSNLNGWYITAWDSQMQRMQCWGYDGIRMDTGSYGTWLAYLSKP